MVEKNLQNKIALVTGATRGIGKIIALTLAQKGAVVIGTATSNDGAQTITRLLTEQGLQGEGIVLNVTDQQQVDHLIEQLTERNQLPHILVNNAGITCDNLLLRMDDSEWYQVMETNLNAVFRLARACIKPMFKARWGRIINVGSVVGSSGNSGQTNYTAAKAGVIGFSKSLAIEVASRNITVNVVSPGFIDTDMTSSLPDMVKEELLKRIPMRRMGKAEDIAAAVAFLASDEASYVTGTTLHVNGGLYLA